MSRTVLTTSSLTASIFTAFVLIACGGSDVVVGSNTSQKLQTKTDGSPTGDGSTCSWAGTATYASIYGDTPAAPVPTYKLGDDFKSIDGCNECSCTEKGIMCTVLSCGADAGPKACPALARICKDGSTAITGTDCSMKCPEDTLVPCPADAKKCPDGTYVGRGGANCEFAECGKGYSCPATVKQCPDGSFVGPNADCSYPECPTTGVNCTNLMQQARDILTTAHNTATSCKADADCEVAQDHVSCAYGCLTIIAKASEADWEAARARAESGPCAEYNKHPTECSFVSTACPSYAPVPRCVNNKCQE